jgi:hypothetical protein
MEIVRRRWVVDSDGVYLLILIWSRVLDPGAAMDEKEEFIIQSYNTKELAQHYSITPKVLRTWLRHLKPHLGTRIGNYYNVEQVKIIVKHLGWPYGRCEPWGEE